MQSVHINVLQQAKTTSYIGPYQSLDKKKNCRSKLNTQIKRLLNTHSFDEFIKKVKNKEGQEFCQNNRAISDGDFSVKFVTLGFEAAYERDISTDTQESERGTWVELK